MPMERTEENQLVNWYGAIWKQLQRTLDDRWVRVEPAIPFVGDGYQTTGHPKVLVYGSAENLNFKFDASGMVHARNRKCYMAWRKANERSWFPKIHMTPVSDGTLLTVARYLVDVLSCETFSSDPDQFLQQISIGNYGKFSLKGSNKDYANNPALLRLSDDFILADLDILKPQTVILPRTIHDNALARLLKTSEHKPDVVVRIYQTNDRVINRHIKGQLKSAAIPSPSERSGWSQTWLAQIPPKVHMDLYLDWIDWHMKGGGTKQPNWKMVCEKVA